MDVFSTPVSETSQNVCFYFMIGFPWSLYLRTCNISLALSEINSKHCRVNQKKIKSSRKEYVMWTCFKFSPMKNIFRKLKANESLIMVCLQIYRELSNLPTFLRVHSNSKEVSYLSWQNMYPNLKTTCHIKLHFFCELNS